jgi:hypothetical protein
VSAEGVEPSTNSLKGYCSAIELRAHHYNMPQNDQPKTKLFTHNFRARFNPVCGKR